LASFGKAAGKRIADKAQAFRSSLLSEKTIFILRLRQQKLINNTNFE
jgi:hypothetical protein